MSTETKVERGERHVREGRARIARQRKLIDEMTLGGHRTEMARGLLQDFEAVQGELEMHLDFLLTFNR